jgi:hypothetical protein
MQPSIRKHLLWDFDITTFNFTQGAYLVIERVIERGNLDDWRAIIQFYSKPTILAVAKNSKQLGVKDKQFTELIINSSLVN